ncbi:MAG: hypothetical protein ACYTBJ_16215 [Planctomycetota bacterium]|jgi:hypothetical protein
MAFADHIGNDVGVMYYLRISGIPYVFSNHALPALWVSGGLVTIGGEDYTPSTTLVTERGFIYKNTIQPKMGLGKSDGMGIEFTLDDTWLDLISIHVYRNGGDRYSIFADSDVVPGATTIPLDSSSGASPGDLWYAGLETMDVDSVTDGFSVDPRPSASMGRAHGPAVDGHRMVGWWHLRPVRCDH